MRILSAIAVSLLLGLSAGSSMAIAGSTPLSRQVEASMLVLGSLTVAPDGSVATYALDDVGELPAPVVDLIRRNIASWRFEPVMQNGHAVLARSRMSLRVLARPTGQEQFALSIHGVHFGERNHPREGVHMTPPQYPRAALQARVAGTVYLALKIDPQGHVADAVAEQVNLRITGGEAAMKRYREVLARSAEWAARHWEFGPLAAGKPSAERYAMVPVSYNLRARGEPSTTGPGHWDSYVPGPRQPVPWFDPAQMLSGLAGSVDALPDDGVYMADPGQGLHLLTALDGA
jgi:hypothetical protein